MKPSHRVVESIERSAWTQLFQSVREADSHTLGLTVARIADTTVLRCRSIDSPLLNRAIGFDEAQGRDTFLSVLSQLRAGAGVRFFLHLWPDAAARVAGWLSAARLERYRRSWVKFVRGRETVPVRRVDLRIAQPDSRQALQFGQVMAQGFDLGPAGATLFGSVVGQPPWHPVAAYHGERLVSAGLLYVEGEVGYLAGGSTLSEYRRRGAQGAVMAERIRIALDVGCRWIVTETGEAVGGLINHSHNNMLRNRFVALGARDNYAPLGTDWNQGRTPAS